jgi:Uma2 family endonuclease
MTTATLTAPPAAPTTSVSPTPKVWTVDEFHDLGEHGVFEGRRAMLIHGQILEEGPMNHPHATAATKTEDLVRDAFGRKWHLRVSKPLVLGQTIDPMPDVAVIVGRPDDYSDHPTTADLIVEVSDTSLRYDTGEKMSLYAAGALREYWVLDLNSRTLIVHRDPGPNANATFGHAYASVHTLGPTDSVSPLAAPTAIIRVADLLP